MAAASSKEKKLQQSLEQELRSTLCSKVLLDGEKSLDLLQGLLVYLAWYAAFPDMSICFTNNRLLQVSFSLHPPQRAILSATPDGHRDDSGPGP
jgi:hypothetical protein